MTTLDLTLGAFAILVLPIACSASGDPNLVGENGGYSPAAASGSGGSGGDSLSGVGGTGGSCLAHCSSDLHQVLDCTGAVLETCPASQGCGAKVSCVPACQAAVENKSAIGCDYYSVDPDIHEDARGSCFAAFIANTWDAPLTIGVEYGGASFNVESFARTPSGSGQSLTYAPLSGGQLPPGGVGILFLSQHGSGFSIPCPAGITPAIDGDTTVTGTGRGSAFHITTSAPIVAYDLAPFGGGNSGVSSATLLLPTSAWDTNYVAVNAFPKTEITPDDNPTIAIVAEEDATDVTISPTAAIVGSGTVDATAKGVPHTYTLSKGDVLQFTQPEELTGSPIQSSKPIGVWGGATCMTIDVGDYACDMAHQQIPPVRVLGSEYVAVRYRNRIDGKEETVPWRLVGAADGTTLAYDPSPPSGAPAVLASGQVAKFWTSAPFVVKSQDKDHPFYVSGHMTGSFFIGDGSTGDPEFVNVVPAAQYLSSYVFFTDPTYPETNLVFVRTKQGGTFKDVVLDCAGTLGGWQDVGGYQYTRVDLSRNNYEKQGNCDNGRHEAHSDAPFGVTVWGWSNHVNSAAQSYAYPAGASIKPINQVVVLPVPK